MLPFFGSSDEIKVTVCKYPDWFVLGDRQTENEIGHKGRVIPRRRGSGEH